MNNGNTIGQNQTRDNAKTGMNIKIMCQIETKSIILDN